MSLNIVGYFQIIPCFVKVTLGNITAADSKHGASLIVNAV